MNNVKKFDTTIKPIKEKSMNCALSYSILSVLPGCLLLTTLAFATVPQTINYQGYLKNTNGTPVGIATTVRFSLYSSNPARNNPVWMETRSVTPANGIYSVQLGSQTPITAPFDVPYHLGVKVGADAEMALQPLASVSATRARRAYGTLASGCSAISASAPTFTPRWYGTSNGAVMGVCEPSCTL